MATIEINKKIELTEENISDLMVTALEGGINYWCSKVKVIECPKDYQFASDVIAVGGKLMIYDAECDEKHELTLEKFLRGVKMYCEEYSILDVEELMDNHDADTADQIIQFALYDSIVYC